MSILGNLAAATIKIALLPIAVAADAVTMCGAITEEDEPYTVQAFGSIAGNVGRVINELETDK